MMADRVRFAHIGVSFPRAIGYLETLLLMPEVEIVALYDPDPGAARGLLPAALQSLPMYDDVADLLAKERPEAVIVTLPADVTPQVMIQVAEAGAHLHVEKPCARTAAEFLPAAKAIRKAGVQFATGFTRRFSPVGETIKNLVDRGILGRLVSVESRWIATSVRVRGVENFIFSEKRSGGGMLHWLGCHWLDLMRWSTSSEVTEVAAILDNLSGEPITVEDTAALSLRYSNGMLGTLHCTYVTDRTSEQLYFGLRGTKGWLRWEGGGSALEVRSTHPEWAAAPTRVLRFEEDPIGGYGGGAGIVAQRQFIASFRDGVPPMFTTDDILRVLEVLDAAHESSRTGRRVAIGG